MVEAITIATAYTSPVSVKPIYASTTRLIGRKSNLYGDNIKRTTGLQSRKLFG